MFGDLNKSEGVKESGDNLGGVGLFESGIYLFKIKAVYAGKATSGARSVTVEVQNEDTKRSFKTTQWVTSGDAKGNKNYYEKGDEKHFLPGFEIINAICMMTTGKGLAEQTIEEKTLKIWDKDAKAEVPQAVPVLVELTGKEINFGLLKQKVNKQVKNADTGVYEDTAESREINELDRVFHHPSMRTMAEAKQGLEEAEFHKKWSEKWNGQVKNSYKEPAGGTAGRPAKTGQAGGEAKPSSLFG